MLFANRSPQRGSFGIPGLIRKVLVENIGAVFVSELVGTAMLVLLGTGVVANVALAKNKGLGGGFLMVTIGWGFAVFAGVMVAYRSGGHLNPAVTLGLVAHGDSTFGNLEVPVNAVSVLTYIGAQMIGAVLGAVACWLAYKQHFDAEPDPANKLGVFSTGPAIRSYGWNLVTEIIGTFVLVFVVIAFGRQGEASGLAALGPLPVALLVIVIGTSLGGPTGYAINPARDLGPRIAHFILPIKGKGGSDWAYSWVPVVGPVIGGLLAGWAALLLLPLLTS
ncbi:aquaporin family protein [Cryobacterium sp. TMT1-3]|uniref:Aquaporin family protein n=1 Tax=Cryobacterium luteum TaxID=1424661 RepID=A0A1H8DA78_9MICO|nr:aquaporin family protein [Cryobacterium luteum]TFC31089.1 aquaporin family protein [Cryobacterium sp. TMT1-3]SEN03754.1 glycerol uptake facilitator protein [Cryobacterium luteum]